MQAKKKKDAGPSTRASRLTAVRWTVEAAASEFAINPRTLSSRIKTNSIEKGNDGKYSTMDICRAIYDSYEIQRARMTKEQADGAALDNAKKRGDLADKNDLMRRYEAIWSEMRAKILNSSLTDSEKDALMNDLAQLHSL